MKRLKTKEAVLAWLLGHFVKAEYDNALAEVADEVLFDVLDTLEKNGAVAATSIGWQAMHIYRCVYHADVFDGPDNITILLDAVCGWFAISDGSLDLMVGDLFELMVGCVEELSHCRIRFSSQTVRVRIPKAETGEDGVYFDIVFNRNARLDPDMKASAKLDIRH